MAQMQYFTPEDLLGISDASVLILGPSSGGARKSWVDVPAVGGGFVADGQVAIRPREEHTVELELLSGTKTFKIGEAINTNYFITSLSVASVAEKYPRISIGFVKLTAANLFNTGSQKATISVNGGLGVVNLWGATAPGAISSNYSVSIAKVETPASTSGDLAEGGFALYGLEASVQIESVSAITIPVGGKETASDRKGSPTGATTFSKAWSIYL